MLHVMVQLTNKHTSIVRCKFQLFRQLLLLSAEVIFQKLCHFQVGNYNFNEAHLLGECYSKLILLPGAHFLPLVHVLQNWSPGTKHFRNMVPSKRFGAPIFQTLSVMRDQYTCLRCHYSHALHVHQTCFNKNLNCGQQTIASGTMPIPHSLIISGWL